MMWSVQASQHGRLATRVPCSIQHVLNERSLLVLSGVHSSHAREEEEDNDT